MTWAESATWIVLFLCLTFLCWAGKCAPPDPTVFELRPADAEAGP